MAAQPTGRRSQWRAGLPGREAFQRNPREHDRSGRPLYRKGHGQESKLCYLGHALMENRNGLAVLGEVTRATGTAEA